MKIKEAKIAFVADEKKKAVLKPKAKDEVPAAPQKSAAPDSPAKADAAAADTAAPEQVDSSDVPVVAAPDADKA